MRRRARCPSSTTTSARPLTCGGHSPLRFPYESLIRKRIWLGSHPSRNGLRGARCGWGGTPATQCASQTGLSISALLFKNCLMRKHRINRYTREQVCTRERGVLPRQPRHGRRHERPVPQPLIPDPRNTKQLHRQAKI